ncbi:MAG: hypothetical protein AAB728_02465, partial [Patescibacteria group bacterium]
MNTHTHTASPGSVSRTGRRTKRAPQWALAAAGLAMCALLVLPGFFHSQAAQLFAVAAVGPGEPDPASASSEDAASSASDASASSEESASSLFLSQSSDAGQVASPESSSDSSASSLDGARDDTSNGARDDTLTVSSDSSEPVPPAPSGAEGSSSEGSSLSSASSLSSESSSTPPAVGIPDALFLTNANTHLVVRIGRSNGIPGKEELAGRLTVRFFSPAQEEVQVRWEAQDEGGAMGGYLLRIAMPRSFTPGLYRLQLALNTVWGETRATQRLFRAPDGGETEAILLDRTFPLGFTAANTNRATYLPGETLEAQMAVHGGGLPLCGVALNVGLTDPSGGRQAFSIAEGTLQYQESCAARMFTALPDYALASPLSSPGSYALTVTPAEGTHSASSVQAGLPQTLTATVRVSEETRMLDIRRQSVTRTFPGNTEEMTITVTPSAAFVGKITEQVPAGFEVATVEPLAAQEDGGDGSKTLSWERRWEANVPVTLRYTYRTPAQTPLFAAFGPLAAKGTKEVTGEEGSSSSEASLGSELSASSGQSSAASELVPPAPSGAEGSGNEGSSASSSSDTSAASSSGESSSASPAPSSEASGVAE